jgi:hypothetical protein
MHHSVAVDTGAGVMWLYGGVTYALRTGQRRPADTKAGLLYTYYFATSTWEQVATTGGWRGVQGCASAGHPGCRALCVPAAVRQQTGNATLRPTYTHHPQLLPGDQPVSTTLLAFVHHAGALWALPQVQAPSAASLRPAAPYCLHRFDIAARRWSAVRTQVGRGSLRRGCLPLAAVRSVRARCVAGARR